MNDFIRWMLHGDDQDCYGSAKRRQTTLVRIDTDNDDTEEGEATKPNRDDTQHSQDKGDTQGRT